MATESVCYFDTSVIASMLLCDSNADKSLALWSQCQYPVSSQLLVFETTTVIQRVAQKLPRSSQEKWIKESFSWLERISAQMALHEINSQVLDHIRKQPQLGSCRSLDAIHIATAQIFHRESSAFILHSFDKRMLDIASLLGIPTE